MRYSKEFTGELIGTFILVFFGCGSVAVTVLFSAHSGLFQVATIWGISVTLAIYATRHLSCAHLNPAVTIAMLIGKRMNVQRLPVYLIAQFLGAFLAASVVYIIFFDSIAQYEELNHIVRGTVASTKTAMMFGEYYPNPGALPNVNVTMTTAFLAESFGTFALVFLIFSLSDGCNVGRPHDSLTPLFIGFALTIIISIFAPLTQAGFNPARDFSPRIFSFFAGWGPAAFPDTHFGFLVIYIVGPIVGGGVASLLFTKVVEPLMKGATNDCLKIIKEQ